jgi:hypothetical protein
MGASQSAAAAHEAKATRKGRVLIFQDDKVSLSLSLSLSLCVCVSRSAPSLSSQIKANAVDALAERVRKELAPVVLAILQVPDSFFLFLLQQPTTTTCDSSLRAHNFFFFFFSLFLTSSLSLTYP